MNIFNVYCDESCHLENDGINSMTLGAVYCPKEKISYINNRIKEIKQRNNIPTYAEIKWTKISPAKEQVYIDIINYFFDEKDLHFRCLLVPDKSKLNHERFNQSHNDWYYKMYFDMLKAIFSPQNSYNVFIDIKDTHSHERVKKLHEVCCNNAYDFSARIIKKIQPIRSDEVQIMQIVDILIGAIAYNSRNFPFDFKKSIAKQNLINLIKTKTKYNLKKTTLFKEDKFNLFVWEAR